MIFHRILNLQEIIKQIGCIVKRKYEEQNPLASNKLSKSRNSFWKKNWSHVELGAANYGENVNADKTHIAQGGPSKNQHNILFATVDKLVEKKGKKGVIYINDLDKQLVNYTIKRLNKYLIHQYPKSDIKVKPLVGDFFKIDIPRVTTIHLKNPERWFFNTLNKGNKHRLKYFAECSKEGLVLTTYYKSHFLRGVNELGVGYKVLNDDCCPYIHADGTKITCQGNVVGFSIKSLDNIGGRLRSYSSTAMELDIPLRPCI
jgi:hypothetical protein